MVQTKFSPSSDLYFYHLNLFTTALLCFEQLKKIVDALPRKLIVFVTHHHRDHIDGRDLLFSVLVWWLNFFFFFLLSFENLTHISLCL